MGDLNEATSSNTVKLVGADSDGLESNFVEVTGTQHAKVGDFFNGSFVHLNFSISNSSPTLLRVGVSNEPNRRGILAYNDSNRDIYWGGSSVSSSGPNRGILMEPGSISFIPFGDSLDVYAISQGGGGSLTIFEVS